MRRLLDGLYALSAVAAAISLVLIAVVILAQAILRPFGVVVPSSADISGYLMAAATFLALAPTFRGGGHIRVTLLIRSLPAALHRPVEIWCVSVAIALTGFLSWNLWDMTAKSFTRHTLSPGLWGVPLWIPQLVMVIGAAVFVICLLDSLVAVVTGKPIPYEEHTPEESGSLSEV